MAKKINVGIIAENKREKYRESNQRKWHQKVAVAAMAGGNVISDGSCSSNEN